MHLPKRNILTIIVSLLLILFILPGCEETTDPEVERGEIVDSNLKFSYTVETIADYIAFTDLGFNYNLSYDVEAYSLTYRTVDIDGESTLASGAILVPAGRENAPMICLNHGTVTERNAVASVNPMASIEGFVGLLTASMGYYTLVPDYLGYGVSEVMHPYIHARSYATAVVDFIRAGLKHSRENNFSLDEQIFMGGYSEGGYATLAVLRAIEEYHSDEIQLTAVAPMAGPYNVSMTIDTMLASMDYTSTIYPAFILTAYNTAYDWDDLGSIFQEPYDTTLPVLFDGNHSYSEIAYSLPDNLADLLQPDFISDYLTGRNTELISIVEENTLLNWHPTVPLRFFHGDNDEVVPYFNAVTTVENLSANSSATVELITIPNGTHESAGLEAIIGMLDWFEEF